MEDGASCYLAHKSQVYLFVNREGEMCWVLLRHGERGEFGKSYEPEVCKQQALDFVREHIAESETDIRALIELTPPERVARTPLLDLDSLKTWHCGKCVVIGDAAHATTPFVGRA